MKRFVHTIQKRQLQAVNYNQCSKSVDLSRAIPRHGTARDKFSKSRDPAGSRAGSRGIIFFFAEIFLNIIQWDFFHLKFRHFRGHFQRHFRDFYPFYFLFEVLAVFLNYNRFYFIFCFFTHPLRPCNRFLSGPLHHFWQNSASGPSHKQPHIGSFR